jgi:DNA-binding beta-propeller fold protein YncE
MDNLAMIKKLLYILFFIPLLTIGQNNFFTSYPSCYLCYLHEYTQQYNDGTNHDIFFNSTGTYMYILGGDVSTLIYQYSLSPAWNMRSATYHTAYGVGSEETNPYGMFIKPDGTKLYVVGEGSDNIYQYTLSIPWVISTATYDSKYFYIGGSENIPTALFFSSDGSKVFFLGQQNKIVYVLSLLTNWDISTANTEAEEYDFSSDEIYPHALFFSSDGLTMYIEGINQDKIFRYSLSTAWTLPDPWNEATVTPIDNFAITGDQAQGMYFKPDWTKVYTVGSASVNVYYFNEPSIQEEE